MILDNLGIILDIRMLEVYPAYAKATNAYFGSNQLWRFWARRLRPHLKPKQEARLLVNWESRRDEMRQAFLNAVMERRETKNVK